MMFRELFKLNANILLIVIDLNIHSQKREIFTDPELSFMVISYLIIYFLQQKEYIPSKVNKINKNMVYVL